MTLNTGRKLLILAILIGAALRIPGWDTQEEMARWRLYEMDEEQHIDLAFNRFNDLRGGRDTIVHHFHDRPYNVRGYGYTCAAVAYVWYGAIGEIPNFRDMLKVGRQLSTLFALLLIGIVFALGRASGLSPPTAGVAALLMACCDVNATHSHYMIPASGYVMFAWMALLGGVKIIRSPDWKGLALLTLGAGGAIGFKLDIFPMVWGGLLMILLAVRARRAGAENSAVPGMPLWYIPVGIVGAALLIYALWLGWSWDEIVHSYEALRLVNGDTIQKEDHFRDNLITYPAGVLAGIGLPAFGLAVWASVKLLGRRLGELRKNAKAFWTPRTLIVLYVFAYLLTEFCLRWYLDTTFIRRVNVFMPAVALLAAYALHRLKAGGWWTVGVVVWSLGLALVGQSNHWFDNREEMVEWVAKELPPPARVGITAYAFSKNLRELKNVKYYLDDDFDYFILHESFYRRFTARSMTTPFGTPECCWEIHHCGSLARCEDIRPMLMGESDNFRLLKTFRPRDYFPERLLYRHFFGYYETFVGDIRVYERTEPQTDPERTTS